MGNNGQDRSVVLLVDDSAFNRELLIATLGCPEIEIVEASDGAMALERVEREPPDLILLDVRLPKIDGFETCRRLKQNPRSSPIPVIFMTGLSETNEKVRGLELGAVDYITKPFAMEELLARIRVHLQIRKLERGLKEATAKLERANAALEADVALRTEELRRANERLERELEDHKRTEEKRATLQQQIIEAQQSRLGELSTPLIPITDRVVVMPLIGTMDDERAHQMLETALHGVKEQRAKVVILDLTGVKLANAAVAGTLLRTASALRMLGAQTVITGIRPHIAQALVSLNLDLRGIVTLGTLKSGIAYALGRAD